MKWLMDEPTIDLCDCDEFELWYVSYDTSVQYDGNVCTCGHLWDEHINAVGTCTGKVTII